MPFALAALVLAALAQSPAAATAIEVPVLKAGLGPCSADFVVRDADGHPVGLAVVHVRVRYGAMNIKRMDLEVSTNVNGQARIDSLPAKAKPLVFDIVRDGTKGVANQNVAKNCTAAHDVTLK